MKITGIQAQVKNTERYSVFVDGQYAFSLSADALLESRLVNGQELTENDVARFKKLSAEDKAFGLTLAYVTRRMRSEGELLDYFRRKGYADEFGRTVLPKLKRLGLVNDAEFARRWVENRRMLRSSSTKKLRLELRQKKIADDIIQVVLAEDETDERQLLRELVAKKRKQSRYQDDQKLMRYLASQGFTYGDIKAALSDVDV